MIEGEIEQVVLFHTDNPDTKEWNIKEIYEVMDSLFGIPQDKRLKLEEIPVVHPHSHKVTEMRTKIIDYLSQLAKERYEELKKGFASSGNDFVDIEKEVYLRAIDNLWVEHLEAIDYLRTSIGLKGYAQIDPLVAYKKEAYRLFTELMNLISRQVVYNIFKLGAVYAFAPSVMESSNIVVTAPSKEGASGLGEGQIAREAQKRQESQGKVYNQEGKKVGRNDPCPCGSGKKYKKCCGA